MSSLHVVAVAALSRVWVSIMAIASHSMIQSYDTSSTSFSKSIFSAFGSWDGVYFVDIADDGYNYENMHAFFPLYALLTRWSSSLFTPFLDSSTALLVAGWSLSNVCFIVAAYYLYLLGSMLVKNESLAKRSALFFCFCPSGIFMSSCYSESLMCALTFGGMYYLELYRTKSSSFWTRHLHLIFCTLLFGLSSATRSNGLLLSLFIALYRLLESPHPLRAFPRFLLYWTYTAMLGLLAIGPQVAYFAYGIAAYCPSYNLTTIQAVFAIDTKMTADRPWCAKVVPNISAMYMFIQHEYWGVGPFAYYQLKQIPNFLLAAPMIALASYSVWLGLKSGHAIFHRRELAPYFIYLAFLLGNALVVVHIQVITRFLAPCPPIFWAAASLVDKPSTSLSTAGRLTVLYFLIFTVVGAVLFPTFYPWT
ncbi:hypothetical protein AC1031_002953 [Aphanomyces cochlioides]|nr:hypothetical protein AC1031_002953 [Aphanomyces cochlioides]